ncbi:DUF397 domain-containing protein [Actinoplanes sp. NPDC051861]|uniref:DUF397 domain-containing protein n=1 Tax=Actinoplanes sp. NPDC051861 TaxID=3155170 RepID=UPI00342471D0
MNPAESNNEPLAWRKATKSGTSNCVELAKVDGDTVAFRNSRQPDGAVVTYTRAELEAFIDGIKRGEFDDLLR